MSSVVPPPSSSGDSDSAQKAMERLKVQENNGDGEKEKGKEEAKEGEEEISVAEKSLLQKVIRKGLVRKERKIHLLKYSVNVSLSFIRSRPRTTSTSNGVTPTVPSTA